MKTAEDFNNKYKDYLEYSFYGMAINDEKVIKYLDKEFEKEIEENPNFKYSQIKTKFGASVIYSTSEKSKEWEKEVNKILNGVK